MTSSRALSVLAAHARGGRARPGETLAVAPDRLVLSAVDAAPVLGLHEGAARQAGRCVLVWGAEPADEQRRLLDTFVERHAVGHRPVPSSCGRPAAVAVEEGLVDAGDLVVGARAETGLLGGVGALVLRCSPPELAALLDDETLEVVVPASVSVTVEGRLPRWVGPFDLAVGLAEHLGGVAAVRGRVLEVSGPTLDALPVAERAVLCELLAHAGLAALVPPDEATRVWLAARRAERPSPGRRPATAAAGSGRAGGDSRGEAVDVLDARRVRLAARRLPWDGPIVDPASHDPAVDRVVIVGALEELRAANHALHERRVHPRVQLQVQPATRRTLQHALDEGLAGALVRAGATLLPPGAEVEGTPATLATRPLGGGELLAGPAVAAASAAAGRLMDPESMRRAHKRASAFH